MKKFIVVIASLLIAASAHAQFGVVAGLTSSHANLKNAAEDVHNVTQYHVGVTYRLPLLGNALAVQPSLIYNVKGAKFGEIGENAGLEFKNGYLELPVQLQVGLFSLGDLARIYAVGEPFIGCAVTNNVTMLGKDTEFSWDKFSDRLEYGVGLGAGVELIQHVQVSVRYFWNLGSASDAKWQDVKNAVTTKSASGIVASVALLF